MSDSNEMKNDNKHPRLRLPQAGMKAQESHDKGEGLSTASFIVRMNDLMLDLMNDRVERDKALAIVQVGNALLKAAALELKNRELFYEYVKDEQSSAPDPLQLVAARKSA